MLGDGTCQAECNSSACAWDHWDCGCAPGCGYSDIQTCKSACLVQACNFGYVPGYPACDPQVRSAAIYYTVQLMSSGFDFEIFTAYSDCKARCSKKPCSDYQCMTSACMYNFGQCFSDDGCLATGPWYTRPLCYNCTAPLLNSAGTCVAACPRGLSLNPLVPGYCLPASDNTTPTAPTIFYVDPGAIALDRDGSEDRPFADLSEAFESTIKRHTLILLKGTAHLLQVTASSIFLISGAQDWVKIYAPRDFNITIASLDCEQRNPCERAIISVPPQSYFSLLGPTKDDFACPANLWGRFNIRNVDFSLLGTDGQTSNQLFAVFSSTITLTNVTFSGTGAYKYLFNAWDGATAQFANVNFLNLSVSSGVYVQVTKSCAQVSSSTGAYPSSFYFSKGLVSLKSQTAAQSKIVFAYLTFVHAISLTNVKFEKCKSGGDFTVISTSHCLKLQILQCVFEQNLFIGGGVLRQTFDYPRVEVLSEEPGFVCIEIADCVFRYNEFSSGGHFAIAFQTAQQSAVISNCTFENEQITSGKAVFFERIRNLQYANPQGFVYNTGVARIDYPPSFLKISGIVLSNSPTFGISISKYMYVAVTDLRELTPRASCVPLLSIATSYNVSLANVSISEYSCAKSSAAVQLSEIASSLSISHSSFTSCAGTSPHGSAVSVLGADAITLSSLAVTNCNNAGRGVIAISNVAAALKVYRSEFTRNTAQSGGTFALANVTAVEVSESAFRENHAEGTSGGAIFVVLSDSAVSSVLFAHTDFYNNSAVASGGAVHIEKSTLTSVLRLIVQRCAFVGNSGIGAAVRAAAGILLSNDSRVADSIFRDNAAVNEGTLSLHYQHGMLDVTNCSFHANRGDSESCVFLQHSSESTSPTLSIAATNFTSNSGTVVHIGDSFTGSVLYAENVRVAENQGVALSLERTQGNISHSVFEQNRADSAPGMVVRLSSRVEVTDALFSRNFADDIAGAVFISEESTFLCRECSFTQNSADSGGAVSVEADSVVTILDSVFRENSAHSDGAALYLLMSPSSAISNCQFFNNSADGDGTITLFSSTLTMVNSGITGNKNGRITTGVLINLSTFTASGCNFSDQSGLSGVFLHLSMSSLASIVDCRFSNIRSKGGSVYTDDSVLSISHSMFTSCFAESGSGISASSSSKVTVTATDFQDHSNSDGGCIQSLLSTVAIARCRFIGLSNSAVYAADTALAVEDTLFSRMTHADSEAPKGAAVWCDTCESLSIATSQFSQLRGGVAAGLYLDQQSKPSVFQIAQCTFTDNHADEGAGIYANSVSLSVSNSLFRNNSATGEDGSGGAISLLCEGKCEYSLASNGFQDNSASRNGGAVSWKGAAPRLQDNWYSGNSAEYGANVSSTPVNLTTLNTSLDGVASGQVILMPLVLDLIDCYGQHVSTDNVTSAELSVPAPSMILGGIKVAAVRGQFFFTNIVIVATPGSATQLLVSVPSLQVQVALNVSMRNCSLGESNVDSRCLVCEPSTYSFDPAKPCQDCPPHCTCLGDFTVVPHSGYWRADALSPKAFKCPNPDACIGAPALTGTCADGYEGNLCQTCSAGFQRTSKLLCIRCSSRNETVLKSVGVLVGMLLFCLILVRASIKAAHKVQAQHSISLKILMNYVQLVMLLGSVNLSWPRLTKQLFDIQDSAGGFAEQGLTIGCLKDDYRESDEFYTKVVIIAVVPPIFCGFSSLMWVLWAAAARSPSVLRNELVCSAIVLFFLVHPSVVRVMFSAVSCEEIMPGEYWVAGLVLRCWQGRHWKYALGVAIPSIIVWGAGVPSIILVLMIRQRKNLETLSMRIRFGYLFQGYARQKFYWEFVAIYRKLLIITIAAFLGRVSITLQALLAFAILLFSLMLHEAHKPYRLEVFNVMEYRGLFVSVVTLFAGLYSFFGTLSDASEKVFFAVIVAVNVHFLEYWLRKSFSSLLQAANRMFILRWCYQRVTRTFRVRKTQPELVTVTAARELSAIEKQLYISKLGRQLHTIRRS